MADEKAVPELASSPCQAPPGYWDEESGNTSCPAIVRLWDRLAQVRTLAFVARSDRPGGWNGKGSGTVVVEQTANGIMTFTESGLWRQDDGRDIRFSNVFRWTVAGQTLRLEHLRFGKDHPVYLFDLAQVDEREWRSVVPHLCSEDHYAATMLVQNDWIILRWTIDGPHKQAEIEYRYGQEAFSLPESGVAEENQPEQVQPS